MTKIRYYSNCIKNLSFNFLYIQLVIFMSNHIKKTEEMRKFEDETGKKAIWRGVITKEFRRWQKGEKIYIDNIQILV